MRGLLTWVYVLGLGLTMGSAYGTTADEVSREAQSIIFGSSSIGDQCEAKHVTETVTEESTPSKDLPATCADFSGEWEGVCDEAYVLPWRVVDHVNYYREESVHPGKVVLKGLPDFTHSRRITVTQEGCARVHIATALGTAEDLTYSVLLYPQQDKRRDVEVKWQRSCEIKANHAHWKRSFLMDASVKEKTRWNSDGSQLNLVKRIAGDDDEYGATFLKVNRSRLFKDAGYLRLDSTEWLESHRYDPAPYNGEEEMAMEPYATTCTYRKVN